MKVSQAMKRKIEAMSGLESTPKPRKPAKVAGTLTVAQIAFRERCLGFGLPAPEPEFPFSKKRKWRFDWFFPFGPIEIRGVALEIDGGIFGRGKPCPVCGRKRVGAHSSISQQLKDREKDREAQILGNIVLRVTPAEMKSGAALEYVKSALESRR